MQRIIEKTLERSAPPEDLYLNLYYPRCRVFVISGYKEAVKKQVKKKVNGKNVTTEEIEPEQEGRDVYELEENSKVEFIPASIACVNKEDLCLSLFVTDVYYRKQNYGSQLMSVLKEVYQGQKLHLFVRESNQNAINFYIKHGWQEVERIESYYKYTKKDENAIKMELQL